MKQTPDSPAAGQCRVLCDVSKCAICRSLLWFCCGFAVVLLWFCRKVNTLHLHSDQVHLLGSASDGTVAVWDVRQLTKTSSAISSGSSKAKSCKAVAAGHHMKSSQGAYWEPGGGRRVLSISFDDTLKIWNMEAATLTQQVGAGAGVLGDGRGPGMFKVRNSVPWKLTALVVAVGHLVCLPNNMAVGCRSTWVAACCDIHLISCLCWCAGMGMTGFNSRAGTMFG
jgi:hypothetical protein